MMTFCSPIVDSDYITDAADTAAIRSKAITFEKQFWNCPKCPKYPIVVLCMIGERVPPKCTACGYEKTYLERVNKCDWLGRVLE